MWTLPVRDKFQGFSESEALVAHSGLAGHVCLGHVHFQGAGATLALCVTATPLSSSMKTADPSSQVSLTALLEARPGWSALEHMSEPSWANAT